MPPQRVAEIVQTFHYDAMDRIHETRTRTGRDSRRFYRGTLLAAQVKAETPLRYLHEAHRLLAIHRNLEAQLPGVDQQGSVLLAGSSNATQRVAYTGHGYTATHEGLGFCGELNDSATGCYLLGNGYRAYHPDAMRFRSPDSFSPFGAGGINPYAYCKGDPINRSDPTGHFDWMHVGMIAFLAIGGISAAGSLGIATPAFAALRAILSGSTVIAGSVTAASVYAAVSTTAGVTSGLMQIASVSLQGAAKGDANLINTARIVSFAGGAVGAIAAITGGIGRALARNAMLKKQNLASPVSGAVVTRQNSDQYTGSRPSSADTSTTDTPLSTRTNTPQPAYELHTSPPRTPLLRVAPRALTRDDVPQDVQSLAARLRSVSRSEWSQRDMANLLNRIEESTM